jgi:hypothetical protein
VKKISRPTRNKNRRHTSLARTLSKKKMWAMKREAQKRDRELVASGKLPPELVCFIRPDMLVGATVEFSADELIDGHETKTSAAQKE